MDEAAPSGKTSASLSMKHAIPPRLRHRSRCSESENGSTETPAGISSTSATEVGQYEDSVCRENNPQPECSSDSKSNKTEAMNTSKNSRSEKKPYRSVLSLMGFELTRGYHLAGDESHYEERRERVYTFMSTPVEVEKFCMFGLLQCVDTFLFFAAFLPIRVVIAVIRILSYPCALLLGSFQGGQKKSRRMLQPAQVCDLLKGLLLGLSCFFIDFIDTSRMYHMVRGQAVIKLYVFYNMLDLADKLVSGTGQDMLDALYWTATEPGRKKRRYVFVCLHFILALLYILLHTVLILGQATVLNVAFNSHNKALLTIMISNNFVEIKASLFKRMDKNNLQQISCGDVKERFHYAVLLFVVFVRNMTEFNWNPEHVWTILQDTLYVGCAEVVVDWVKHAFITKFNEISSETYRTFKINLAQDILTSQEKYAHTDYSDQVCRRLGLAPIPLVCLLIQVCSKSVHITGTFSYLLLLLFFLCLVSTKVLTSILLLSWGCRLLEDAEEGGRQTDPCNIDSQVLAKKDTSPKEGNASEKNSPVKHPPDKPQLNGNNCEGTKRSSVETVSGNLGIFSTTRVGDSDSQRQHASSDPVVEHQSQLLRSTPSPVRKVQLFTSSDSWEVDSADSDSEFHSSLDDSTSEHAKLATAGTIVVDYDDDKKYK